MTIGIDDTIVALATPPGTGALGIVRVSGQHAHSICKTSIRETNRFETSSSKEIHLYRWLDCTSQEIIDEITAIKYAAPYSYTGEDMVEIICHGGTVIVERILESLLHSGARYAGKGEFTRRALLNGKTNLIKAESINQMIHSTTLIQQRNTIQSYLGGYTTLIKLWEYRIKEILVDIETEIEFGEDKDTAFPEQGKIIEKATSLKEDLLGELQKRQRIKEVEQGITIAIIGPVNAGKSSLFNLIMGFERAMVDSIGGTTRDFISEHKKIGSMQVKFIDTAGLINNAVGLEKQGVDKSREFIRECNMLVWVTPANERTAKEEETIIPNEHQMIIGIINKSDLSDGIHKKNMFEKIGIPYITMSAHNSGDKEAVETFIINEIQKKYDAQAYDCVIANKRQEQILECMCRELEAIERRVVGEEDIVAYHCRTILEKIEEFVGKKTPDDVLNTIFDEFCIGK